MVLNRVAFGRNAAMRLSVLHSRMRCRASSGGRGETYPRSVCTHQRLVASFIALKRPVAADMTYSVAVQSFTHVAILGYECGLTEATLSQYLREQPGGAVDWQECLEMVCLIWITLMLSHKAATRWALTDPVSKETLERFQGFVELMVISYFEKGMVWMPIERLQLEQIAMQGASESIERIAEKQRIVFTTLETVAPQFPSL